jgi:hypothetical protein
MKKRAEIIKDLEDQILARLKKIKSMQTEVETLQKNVTALRELGEDETPVLIETTENPAANFPGYPLNGSLHEKFRYLEDRTLKVWMKRDMDLLIEQAEGKRHAAKTLKNSAQKIHYYIKKHELINLKYNNSNKYSFYTTRPEWTEQQNDGTVHLLSQHEPEASQIEKLSEEQRKPENIIWNGIN